MQKRNLAVDYSQPMRKSVAGPGDVLAPNIFTRRNTGSAPTEARKESEEDIELKDFGAFKKSLKGQRENLLIEGNVNIICSAEAPSDFLCCKFSEQFDLLAGGCSDGTVRVYSAEKMDLIQNMADEETVSITASVTSIKHRPVTKNYPINNCFTGTYVNGLVKCWNYNYNQCIYTIRENRQTYGIAYHPRLPKFVTYGDDLKIYLYDEETKIQERVLSSSEKKEVHDGPMSRVFAACFNPRSNYEFLTGGWDNAVHLWDLRAPHSVRHLSGIHICGEGIDVNPKGTEIVTCAWQKENQIQLWDYASFKLITGIQADYYLSKLYCGKFATGDFLVAGGGDPNMLRIVDLQTTMSVASMVNFPSAVYHVDLGPMKAGPKKTKEEKQGRPKAEFNRIPKIAFVSGTKIQQLDVF